MEAREHCYVCDKVASLCLCERIDAVEHRTAVTIVQHPSERRHPFGTARIARLGLRSCAVHVVGRESEELRLPIDAAVLFPDPDAPVLSTMPVADRPTHLVAIDGTWALASQLRRHHPVLARLRAVRLPKGAPSRYRIRREPNAEAISTIEAIVRALRILEPETAGLEALLSSFDAMIDDQLERRDEYPRTPRHRHRPRSSKPLPVVLRGIADDVALVHVELHQPRGQERRFSLRVVVSRAHRGELVDVLVKSPIAPSPARVENMELGPLSFDDALDPSALAALLRDVIRPRDTIVAWPQSPASTLRAMGLEHPFLSAKHHYANQQDARVGKLDDVVARLGGPPVEPWAPGRAGRQIAQLALVVRAMRARAMLREGSSPDTSS